LKDTGTAGASTYEAQPRCERGRGRTHTLLWATPGVTQSLDGMATASMPACCARRISAPCGRRTVGPTPLLRSRRHCGNSACGTSDQGIRAEMAAVSPPYARWTVALRSALRAGSASPLEVDHRGVDPGMEGRPLSGAGTAEAHGPRQKDEVPAAGRGVRQLAVASRPLPDLSAFGRHRRPLPSRSAVVPGGVPSVTGGA
jgi:hypothetical protein